MGWEWHSKLPLCPTPSCWRGAHCKPVPVTSPVSTFPGLLLWRWNNAHRADFSYGRAAGKLALLGIQDLCWFETPAVPPSLPLGTSEKYLWKLTQLLTWFHCYWDERAWFTIQLNESGRLKHTGTDYKNPWHTAISNHKASTALVGLNPRGTNPGGLQGCSKSLQGQAHLQELRLYHMHGS